jgi:hypothetical protein
LGSYEKSNIQEQIMRNGEYEFLQRQNEVSGVAFVLCKIVTLCAGAGAED